MYKVFCNEILFLIGENIGAYPVDNEMEMPLPDHGFIFNALENNARKNLHFPVEASKMKQVWEDWTGSMKVVEAAGGLVRNEREEWLAIHRNGRWDLPKGKLEKGEDRHTGAGREVQEECGIKVLNPISHRLLPEEYLTSYHIYDHKGKLVLKPTYWFEFSASSDEVLLPQLEEGIDEVLWLNESELLKRFSSNSFYSLYDLFNAYLLKSI